MTVLLLLAVFVLVNVSCLRLHSDEVEHDHYRAPTIMPVLGVVVCVGLMTQNEASVFARAGVLLVIATGLWLVDRLVGGARQEEIDPTNLGA